MNGRGICIKKERARCQSFCADLTHDEVHSSAAKLRKLIEEKSATHRVVVVSLGAHGKNSDEYFSEVYGHHYEYGASMWSLSELGIPTEQNHDSSGALHLSFLLPLLQYVVYACNCDWRRMPWDFLSKNAEAAEVRRSDSLLALEHFPPDATIDPQLLGDSSSISSSSSSSTSNSRLRRLRLRFCAVGRKDVNKLGARSEFQTYMCLPHGG
jgi:hypothetical protein